MLCPYCGKEMRKGYIQAASHIIFSEKKHLLKLYPSNAQDIQIAEQTLVPAAVSAYYCTRCEMFIINGEDIADR